MVSCFIEWIQRIQQPLITIHIPCVHYHMLCECRSSLALCMASLMYNSLLHELLKKITQDFAFSWCESLSFILLARHSAYLSSSETHYTITQFIRYQIEPTRSMPSIFLFDQKSNIFRCSSFNKFML